MDHYRIVDGRILNRRCEINVAEHCNLSCRSCSHLSPVLSKSFADPDVVARDLTALSRSYHAKVVRLLGGEPLLHPDLPAVIDAVRRSGACDSIMVVTNGLLLPRMTAAFWSSIDAVEVSVYPGRSLTASAQQACAETAERHGVALRFRACDEFQESYSETGTDDTDLVDRIFTTCNIAHRWRCHNVIDGWFFRCPQAHYIPKLLRDDPDVRHADGLQIDDTPAFRGRLLAYLRSPEPPQACANCLGTAGRYEAHAQIRRVEFRERQRAPTEDLVHPRLVGPLRVTLARIESRTPRRLISTAEDALLSPTLIRFARKAQQVTRAVLRISDHNTPAPAVHDEPDTPLLPTIAERRDAIADATVVDATDAP
jgi:organic radical activating enzyme